MHSEASPKKTSVKHMTWVCFTEAGEVCCPIEKKKITKQFPSLYMHTYFYVHMVWKSRKTYNELVTVLASQYCFLKSFCDVHIQCKWACVFSCMRAPTWRPEVLVLAFYLLLVTGSPWAFVAILHWARQASWPISTPGSSCLHLPFCHRNPGRTEMCFCTIFMWVWEFKIMFFW